MNDRLVTLGRIIGVFGVKGWVKVESFTQPSKNLLDYRFWQLAHAPISKATLDQSKAHGRGLVIKLREVNDRDLAAELVGAEIQVLRSEMPVLKPNEIYWVDLEGLEVVNTDKVRLGVVSHLFATGANDVMVVQGEREHLIPYVPDHYIKKIDMEQKTIIVDWDPAF